MPRLNGDKNWLEQLPWVLLGQRTTPNSDTGIAPALLVYGQHPDLPGPIVLPKDDITSYQQYSQQLATVMNQLEFTTVPWHGGEKKPTYVPKTLMDCEYVLIRVDKVQPSLCPRYTGPHRVLERGSKDFMIQLEDRADRVSIDRLKPFYK